MDGVDVADAYVDEMDEEQTAVDDRGEEFEVKRRGRPRKEKMGRGPGRTASDTGGVEFVEIGVELVAPSPFNKRKFRGPDEKNEGLLELAKSIEQDGVIEPIIVRPHPFNGNLFELVSGERRLRASKLAKRQTIPALVRGLTDEAAARIVVVENAQREDLGPLEEAASVQVLAHLGWSVERISDELGRSRKWVARRLSLMTLIEGWRELFDGELSGWSVRHMEVIARLPAHIQDEALTAIRMELLNDWSREYVLRQSVGELKERLSDASNLLSHAPWKKDDETLVPAQGSCAACRRRSDVQPELFEPEDFGARKKGKADDVLCLDGACWRQKLEAWRVRREDELRAKHGDALVVTEKAYAFVRCKKNEPGAVPVLLKQTAAYCDGADGEFFYGKPVQGLRGTAAGSSAGAGKEKSNQEILKEKRAQLAVARSRIVAGLLSDRLLATEGSTLTRDAMLSLVSVIGLDQGELGHVARSDHWREREHNAKDMDGRVYERIARAVMSKLAGHVREMQRDSEFTKKAVDAKYMREACAFASLDYELLVSEAAELKPEPKGWAKLEEKKKPVASTTDAQRRKGKKAKTKTASTDDCRQVCRRDDTDGEGEITPGVCRYCGCTDGAACYDAKRDQPCSWVDEAHTVCSACEDVGEKKAKRISTTKDAKAPRGKGARRRSKHPQDCTDGTDEEWDDRRGTAYEGNERVNKFGVFENFETVEIPVRKGAQGCAKLMVVCGHQDGVNNGLPAEWFSAYEYRTPQNGYAYAPSITGPAYPTRAVALQAALDAMRARVQLCVKGNKKDKCMKALLEDLEYFRGM